MIDLLTRDSQTPAAATSGIVNKTGVFSMAGDALSLAMKALGLTDAGRVPEKDYAIITLDQVSWHDHDRDCWIVLYDKVYDITNFLQEHPGGAEILLEYAGRDATLAFRGIGHGTSALQGLEPYMVGVLPESERIFIGGKLAGLTMAAAC